MIRTPPVRIKTGRNIIKFWRDGFIVMMEEWSVFKIKKKKKIHFLTFIVLFGRFSSRDVWDRFRDAKVHLTQLFGDTSVK